MNIINTVRIFYEPVSTHPCDLCLITFTKTVQFASNFAYIYDFYTSVLLYLVVVTLLSELKSNIHIFIVKVLIASIYILS